MTLCYYGIVLCIYRCILVCYYICTFVLYCYSYTSYRLTLVVTGERIEGQRPVVWGSYLKQLHGIAA